VIVRLPKSAGRRLPGTPEPMHRWLGTDGVVLAGDAWGDPDRQLVVLQHGGGQTRHAWKETGQRLADAGYYAVAFDARGHGDSDWATDGAYGQDVMVQDLQCVVAALGQLRPILVGASMGGGVSLVASGEHHVDARALVMVDVAARSESGGIDRIQAFMAQNPAGFDTLEEAAAAIAAYQPLRGQAGNLDGLGKNVRLGADGKFHWHWDPRFLAGIRHLGSREQRLTSCARALRLPTLLVRGGLSDVLSEDGAREFLRHCPHSEYVNVSEAGHMVAGDRNDVFGQVMLDFLRRTVPVT
jgi:pimeloyl-ACP methyl ester carboxylesterase